MLETRSPHPDALVRAFVLEYNLTPDDVARIRADVPRIGILEAVEVKYPLTTKSQRKNFDRPKRELVASLGHLDVASATYDHLAKLATDLFELAVLDGHSGAYTWEHTVGFFRWFFKEVVRSGWRRDNPAEELGKKKRPVSPRRALADQELEDFLDTCQLTGNDPLLDTALFWLMRESAARPVSIYRALVSDLDQSAIAIRLRGKADHNPLIPISPSLLEALLGLHARRAPDLRDTSSHLFRQRDGQPLTYKRFESLAARLQRQHGWARQLPATSYYIRHTTLRDIRRARGRDMAKAYAGHFSKEAIEIYAGLEFEELREAHDSVFGADVSVPTVFRRAGVIT